MSCGYIEVTKDVKTCFEYRFVVVVVVVVLSYLDLQEKHIIIFYSLLSIPRIGFHALFSVFYCLIFRGLTISRKNTSQ